MNLLLFNYSLSVQSVYLCFKFDFVLYTANITLVYANALYIQYLKIIIVYPMRVFFQPSK